MAVSASVMVRRVRLATFLLAVAGSLLLLLQAEDVDAIDVSGTDKPEGPRSMQLTHDAERLARIGPQACASCHAPEVEDWLESDHAKANHPDPSLFREAFELAKPVELRGGKHHPQWSDDGPVWEFTRPDGLTTRFPVIGVLANEPLWQALVPGEAGRVQVTSVAHDPARGDWFHVFEDDHRLPGEWGHWLGQGMNWNSNCAYCHMTDFRKQFNVDRNAYESTWLQHGIACAECHDGLDAHVADPEAAGFTAVRRPEQIEAVCAGCHSRRDQLTADAFVPGGEYSDHYGLSLPDQPGLYYADGQILDEVFVFGSLKMSRMGHAGVSCMDCHDPHSNELILPVANNALCLSCHAAGLDGAPVIKPEEHSFHPPQSTGNRCVECHMPHTTYMARDDRRDHGFLSPDPLMTRELGIPNACNRCHETEGLDWQIEWAEKWYGEALAASRQRQRARVVSAAWRRDAEAEVALLELLEKEDIAAWRATYIGLLGGFPRTNAIADVITAALSDESPWVRQRAVRVASPDPDGARQVAAALRDEAREVRLGAAEILSDWGAGRLDERSDREWLEYLVFNGDRPVGAMRLAQRAVRSGDVDRAKRLIAQAVGLEPGNPVLLQQASILSSGVGDLAGAERLLLKAREIAPENADVAWSLALLRAELGDLEASVELMEEVVRVRPDFYRGWYNLTIARIRLERWQAAEAALRRALELGPDQAEELAPLRQMLQMRRKSR